MKTRSMLLVLFTTFGMFILRSSASAQASAPAEHPDPKPSEEEWSLSLPPGTSPEDVLKSINDKWATEKDWTKLNTDGHSNSRISIWKFTDRTGQAWIATAKAHSCQTRRGNTLVTLKIVRAATLVARCRARKNSAMRSVRLDPKPEERPFYYYGEKIRLPSAKAPPPESTEFELEAMRLRAAAEAQPQ